MSATKTCSKCGTPKPLSDFKTDSRKPDGKASSCRDCNAPIGKLIGSGEALPAPVNVAQLEKLGTGMIPFHPLADIFPLIEGAEFDELVQDIQVNGLRDPIVLLDGQILDGRNRYRACVAAGLIRADVAPGIAQLKYFRWFVPAGAPTPSHDDLVAFVVSKNLRRRQLDDDQRRMVAARLVNLKQGRPAEGKTSQIENISREKAAEILTSDIPGIDRARSVLAHAVPEVIAAVDERKMTVAAAAEIAAQPVDRQHKIVESLPRDGTGKLTREAKRALAPIIKEIRAERQVEKKERRDNKERLLGGLQQALPNKRYGVILADPEWRFEPFSPESGMDRAADNHYPTSATEVIAARPVGSIAATDCVLFLWATVPMLEDALHVLKAWGFAYRSHFVWVKDRLGTGYWNRNQHELLLIGVRGNPPAPAPGTRERSVIKAPVGEHSAKPEVVLDCIEGWYPTLPKIELNRRGPARAGWDAWGNEAPEAAA